MLKTEKLKLVSEWDKTFPQSEKVDHREVCCEEYNFFV